jgi:NAD(P)-dependent dehydrogenase (short-subunit alcohol dehydrogenase family)
VNDKVWLITGSSRGLGRSIAEAVLASGDSLVATARQPDALRELATRYGSRIRTIRHDVTDAAAASATVQLALEAFGRLDVVVNNAGYGRISPIEQSSDADIRAELDTNFMGVVHVTRAALPLMRRQRSGHIIQVSSVGGRMGSPGFGAYVAAKWAVGGFSEVLAKEVAHLGIKVTVLEPGGMRTGFNTIAHDDNLDILPDYLPSVGPVRDMLAAHFGQENSDPTRIAELVLRLSRCTQPPLHLLLGSDSLQYVEPSETQRRTEGERWAPITRSTDATASGRIPEFPNP